MTEIMVKIVRVGNPLVDPNLIVEDTFTVAKLKRNIRSFKWPIPVDEQMLVYYKQVLDDSRTLESYGIGEESKIQLLVQVPGAMPITYRINGKQAFLRVRKKDLITKIKEKISVAENVAVNKFYLTLGGKMLQDDATVAESGITINAEVTCNNS